MRSLRPSTVVIRIPAALPKRLRIPSAAVWSNEFALRNEGGRRMFDLRSVRVTSGDSRWKGGKMRERRCCSFVKPAVSASPSSKRSLSSSSSFPPFTCLTNLVHRPGGFPLTQSFQAFSSSSLPKLFSPFPSFPISHISTGL